MPKARNKEAEERIAACAMRSLLERGYNKTTYQVLSDETGFSRAYIQHYVPEKERLLQIFFDRLLEAAETAVSKKRTDGGILISLFLTGQIYFSFLSSKTVRQLALDILENRKLTEATIALNEVYERSKTGVQNTEEITTGLTRILGGSYELLYTRLSSGKSIDATEESLQIAESFADLVGWTKAFRREKFLSIAFNEQDIAAIMRWIPEAITH